MVAFEDETWAELLPKLWKCWYLKGKQLEVETPGVNKRINVFITLDFRRRVDLQHSPEKEEQGVQVPLEEGDGASEEKEVQARDPDSG